MHSQVLEQRFLGLKVLLVALWAGLAPQEHLQVGLQVGLESLKTGKAKVTLVAWVVPIAPYGRGGVPSHSVALGGGDLHI